MEERRRGVCIILGVLTIILSFVVGRYACLSVSKQAVLCSVQIIHDGGRKCAAENKMSRALKIYAMAVNLYRKCEAYPDFALDNENGFLLVGNCYCGLGQYRNAVEYYERGLKFMPNSIILLTALGNSAAQEGDLGKAILSYRKSLEIFPYSSKVKKSLKDCRRRQLRRVKDGS